MASAYLYRTLGTPTNANKGTVSHWVKRSGIGASTQYGTFAAWNNGGTAADRSHCNIYDDTIYFYAQQTSMTIQTNRKFRDTNGWYHMVIAWDTTQSTASDRVKIYINGVQETSFGTANYPGQNNTLEFNVSGRRFGVGCVASGGNAAQFWDGEIAHFHFVDGTAYTPTTFGETDATTGIWKPKVSPSVTYGNNGFFLKFDNSANMGLDSSGNSNNLTTSGTIIQNKDTPSNVFATINPLDYSPNPATLENTNTTYNKSSTGSGHNATMTGTLGVTKGKYYFEFKPTNTSAFVAGIVRTNHGLPNSEGYYATDAGSYGITNGSKIVGGSEQSQTVSYSANDIFGMAYDLDNGKFYVHINGTYLNSGDPTSGSTGTGSLGNISLGSNIYVPVVSNANYDQTNVMHFNFGNGYFGTTAVSSAGTNASNNGIFEYDVPSGYTALCTKGLNL